MNAPGHTGERAAAAATILNVNDHPATLYLVSQTLRLAGYQVTEAATGREALKIAMGQPDLVLLDVHLPDIDGYEVCRRLRSQPETRDLLIAHLSAVSVQREDRIRGLAYGADAYWTTPMEEEELLANIEALLRLQRRAQDAIRVRDDFLSVAAHELKTPLTAMRLNLERTLYVTSRAPGEMLPKVTVERSLAPALRQLDQLRRLLDTLLDVSRLTSHRLNLEIGATDLVEIACDVAMRLEAPAKAAGVELRLELPHGPVILFGDRLRLEQQSDMAALSVNDQGIGIAPQDQARIFNRFERATTTRQSDSLGLGLFITKEIVAAHGGTITVNSELGRGTTFQVLLPLRRTERY